MNVDMFNYLDPTGNYRFANPSFENFSIQFLFDVNHIIKNIRNIFSKATKLKFIYPDPEDLNKICTASYKDIIDVYEKEKNLLIKKAPKLNKKTISPSSFEKQQVSLATNIFDEKTTSALEFYGHYETAKFLNYIRQWYFIMTNRSTLKGVMKRDIFRDPIRSPQDHQVLFLKDF